tara:strand:+ start:89 stop:268 length:180 start_codon:yes stop_codon:yes gene_type:complete
MSRLGELIDLNFPEKTVWKTGVEQNLNSTFVAAFSVIKIKSRCCQDYGVGNESYIDSNE